MIQKFLAIDGALRNFGIAKGYINGNQIRVNKLYLIEGKKSNRAGDVKHARLIASTLNALLKDTDIVFAESSTGSKSAAAAWSLGITVGLLTSLNKPIQFVRPRQAKAITGDNRANKWAMIKWAVQEWPNLNWVKQRNGKLLAKNEHCADACAIAVAGLKLLNQRTKNGYFNEFK